MNKNTFIKYSISISIATFMAILTLYLHGFWESTELVDKYRILSDAFTIPGVVFILVGCLVFLSNQGSLTAIGYMMKRFFKMLNPIGNKNIERYSDYVENRSKVTGYAFLFYTGILFSAVSIVFMILFYSVYNG